MEVFSFCGFAASRADTRDFNLDMSEGVHNITAYIESDGITVSETYGYDGKIEEEEEVEEEEEEEDWLPCPSGGC